MDVFSTFPLIMLVIGNYYIFVEGVYTIVLVDIVGLVSVHLLSRRLKDYFNYDAHVKNCLTNFEMFV